jgi:hypothetical protein
VNIVNRFSKQTRVENGREAMARNLLGVLKVEMIVLKTGRNVDQIQSLATK